MNTPTSDSNFEFSPTQQQITWVALAATALPFLLIALNWSDVPERVPIHFNSAGDAR